MLNIIGYYPTKTGFVRLRRVQNPLIEKFNVFLDFYNSRNEVYKSVLFNPKRGLAHYLLTA